MYDILDVDSCLAEIHKKLYSREVYGKACSDRAEILYYFLKYHNLQPKIARYKRMDGKKIILISGEDYYESHVVVILNKHILDSNFKKKVNKEDYIKKLNELNENQITKYKEYNLRTCSFFVDIVNRNLSERFKKAFDL